MTTTVEGFNPFDNAQDIPWERFAELREECPVSMLETGQYFLTRYDDVHDALKDGGERLHNFAHEGGMRAPGSSCPRRSSSSTRWTARATPAVASCS